MQQFLSMQQMQMQELQQSMMRQFKEMDRWIGKKLKSSPKECSRATERDEEKDDESSNSDSTWTYVY